MPSVQLGQFTDEHADAIEAALDKAGISFYTKSFGRLVRTIFAADWGTRVFVERADLERAAEIAREIAPHGVRKRLPS
jgi:hypothetical protein